MNRKLSLKKVEQLCKWMEYIPNSVILDSHIGHVHILRAGAFSTL